MQSDDALSGFSARERADIEALLTPAAPQDLVQVERIGLIHGAARLVLRALCVALVAAIGWHIYALASLPDRPFDAVHTPLPLTFGTGLAAILFLLWFDGRPRRLLLLLLGVVALAGCGLSMRWVDSSRQGVREHWAGIQRARVGLSGDLCYRTDANAFMLRGAGDARFVYARGFWPGIFDEATFRRYFFSDVAMRPGPDGWTCIDRR